MRRESLSSITSICGSPDDRIALLGANGNGKSTFAQLLAGRLQPSPVRCARTAHAQRLFPQHQIEELEPDATPYDHLAAHAKAVPEEIRARLARFGFGVDKVFVKAGAYRAARKRV